MRLGRRHLSGAYYGCRQRGHRLLSPCTLGGGRASLVCAAKVLSEKRTEHLLHRADGRGAESRMQELGVVLGLADLQMLEVRQRRLLEERVCVEQPRTALPTGTRMSPPDRAVLRAYTRVAVSSVVLLAVAVRERRKLESHEARRGLRDVHGIHVGRDGGWLGGAPVPSPPAGKRAYRIGTLPIWNKRPLSAGDGAASAGSVGRD